MLKTYLIVALIAYLLGSIPFGYILVKLFLKQDIRKTGSGNIGATNVARSGKKGLAIATLLLDAAKGFAAVAIAALIRPSYSSPDPLAFSTRDLHQALFVPLGTAALFAIVGHCFPVWLKLKGGKGVATAVGAFLAISPIAVAGCFALFVLVFATSRIVSLSSIIAALLFPFVLPFAMPAYPGWKLFALALASSALIILKHRSNIRRMLNGTEPRFGTPKQALPADPIEAEKNA
jgi:glycerol-3-phosphate acyltransferase PlsY